MIVGTSGTLLTDIGSALLGVPSSTRTLVVTPGSDLALPAAALYAGANGVVSGDATLDELADAIDWLDEHDSFVDQRLVPLVLHPPVDAATPADERPSRLTETEREILELIACRYTNRRIAEQMFLSQLTVRNKVSVILRKLGLASRVEAAVFAITTMDRMPTHGVGRRHPAPTRSAS